MKVCADEAIGAIPTPCISNTAANAALYSASPATLLASIASRAAIEGAKAPSAANAAIVPSTTAF